VMKSRSRGTLGHIAIRATNIDRAVMYLSRAGVRFVPGSEKRSPDGRLKAVYLEEEVAGFALHLLQAG
jgi:2-dehydro-3-deoxyphosphogluconate aldolase/(4S)-4-hydroxy-2-oxoglutarate aldolase